MFEPHEFQLVRALRSSYKLSVFVASALSFALVPTASWSADEPLAEHIDQQELYDLVLAGKAEEAFLAAFEGGDELFETVFNSLDGVGAHVTEGVRFSRTPRADLTGADEWASHFPARSTGPNAQSCDSCHNQPFADGAGAASMNVVRDPTQSAALSDFIQRNTPHLFASGALQVLAEEITAELVATRSQAEQEACRSGAPVSLPLSAKEIDFGSITADPVHLDPCEVAFDTSAVEGVGNDLIVRPFQWKGSFASLRSFNRDASHNELGMQSVELIGYEADGDFDDVVNELTVGDQTGLSIYLAAQPRPVSLLELEALELIDPLPEEQAAAIRRGLDQFEAIGCESCHRRKLLIDEPIFREPSANSSFRDELFPAGLDPIGEWVDPEVAVSFDLTRDQPDNRIEREDGSVFPLGALRTNDSGQAIANLFGDLKYHEMGPDLAETIDEQGNGASVWITKELWGVGSTGPWLHDGRATTLTEAIVLHGGEAKESRQNFEALPNEAQEDVVALLESLVLFKIPEEEE